MVAGTTALDACDGGLLPTDVTADTVKVYEVPFFSGEIVQERTLPATHWDPPGLEVAT